MNNLKVSTFLVPVIALILVVVFFSYFSKKASNKLVFRQFIFLTTILAFLLNLAWELIQGPLYEGYTYDVQHITFCALASVADAIMVLLIYFGLALVLNNALWVQNLTLYRILLVMLMGGIGAVLAEIRHLSAGTWAYAESMPIIPFVEVGLSPVLQFIITPLSAYYLSCLVMKKSKKGTYPKSM